MPLFYDGQDPRAQAREDAAKRALGEDVEGRVPQTQQGRWEKSLKSEPRRHLGNIGRDFYDAFMPDSETLKGAGLATAGALLPGLGGAGALAPWLDLDFYDRAKWDDVQGKHVGDSNPRTLWEHTPQQIKYRNTTELVPIEDLWRAREFDRPRESWEWLVEDIEKHGLREPLMLEYNPKTQRAYLGEGNHRLAALRELGNTYAPTRVARSSYAPTQGTPQSRPGFIGTPASFPPDPSGYVPANLKPSQIGLPHRGLGDVVRAVREQRPDLVTDEILDAYKYYSGAPVTPRALQAASGLIPGPVEAAGLAVPVMATGQYARTQDPYERLRFMSLRGLRRPLKLSDMNTSTLGLLLQDPQMSDRLYREGLLDEDLQGRLVAKRQEHGY